MEIKNAFYLTGFTRIDKGEQGAVFVRYDEPSERKGKPSINEAYLNYGGKGSESFILSMPANFPIYHLNQSFKFMVSFLY